VAQLGHWLRNNWVTFAVTGAIVWLALENGGYDLTVRAPAAILVLIAIAALVALGVWPRSAPPRAALVVGALLAGFALLNGLSLIWADSAEKAFTEFNRVAFYLAVFSAVVLAARRGSAREWSDGVALGIVVVAALALTSRLFPDLIETSEASRLDVNDPRLSYPVYYWNGLAALLALAVPLLIASAVRATTALRGALALSPFPLLAAAGYLTSSRGGAAAAAIGLIAVLVLTDKRHVALLAAAIAAAGGAIGGGVMELHQDVVDGPLPPDALGDGRSAAALLVLACVVTGALYFVLRPRLPSEVRVSARVRRAGVAVGVVLVLVGLALADPAERFESFKKGPAEVSTAYTRSHLLSSGGGGRWQFWETAIDQFQANPVLGDGAGSYQAWWAQHGTLAVFVRNAHSLFVESLGELGLFGLLVILAVFAVAAIHGVRRVRGSPTGERPVVAGLTAALFAFVFATAIDWMWDLAIVGGVGIICAGLLVGPATLYTTGAPPVARLPIWSRITVAAIVLLLALAQVIPLVADLKISDSQDALKAGDEEAALSAAEDAVDAQGWAASPHLQLALVHETRGDLVQAHEEIARAIDRDRSDWRLWAVEARIEQASGDDAAARRSLDQARKLNPRSTLLNAAN
jgi:hypothetical protein